MYHTGYDPFTGKEIFVEKGLKGKREQKDIIFELPEKKKFGRRLFSEGD